MPTQSPIADHETRQRLLDVAIRLFSEHGFKNVTVREICKDAGANLAAVNYYFRDKLGLYKEVVRMAAEAIDRTKQEALDSGEGHPPEERLRHYIREFLHRLLGHDVSWIDGLMNHEMTEPTAAFDLIVQKGILPHGLRLNKLIGELMRLSPTDERVQLCSSSVQAQCLFYRQAKPFAERVSPGFQFTPAVIDRLSDHVAEFSLAGIRWSAEQPGRDGSFPEIKYPVGSKEKDE